MGVAPLGSLVRDGCTLPTFTLQPTLRKEEVLNDRHVILRNKLQPPFPGNVTAAKFLETKNRRRTHSPISPRYSTRLNAPNHRSRLSKIPSARSSTYPKQYFKQPMPGGLIILDIKKIPGPWGRVYSRFAPVFFANPRGRLTLSIGEGFRRGLRSFGVCRSPWLPRPR